MEEPVRWAPLMPTLQVPGQNPGCRHPRGGGNDEFAYLATTDLPSGSSFFLSLPSMKGDQGLAFTGPGVFHTTLNWPSALISPMNTLLCRWWFFSSIFETMPEGALKVWPALA